MKFKVITLFPEIFEGFLNSTILGRARRDGIIDVELVQLRDFTTDKHKSCDSYPYGGGAGMVLRPEPLAAALKQLNSEAFWTIYLSPGGKLLNQTIVKQISSKDTILLIAGRYEGIDQRIIDKYVDEEISIGNYILSGGEVAAMVIIECVARVVKGVINQQSLVEESFVENELEYPQYTRPRDFQGLKVPDVLLSGNHAQIREWRRQKSIIKTQELRPDLLEDSTD